MDTRTVVRPLPLRHKNEPCCVEVREPALSVGETTTMAEKLKALADSTRLRMLDVFIQQAEPLCVCDVTGLFSQNQPTISHHLRLLRQAGFVETEKRGIWAYYWATEAGRQAFQAVTALL